MELDVQGQGGGRILDVDGQGRGGLENWPVFMDAICVLFLEGSVYFDLTVKWCGTYNRKYGKAEDAK